MLIVVHPAFSTLLFENWVHPNIHKPIEDREAIKQFCSHRTHLAIHRYFYRWQQAALDFLLFLHYPNQILMLPRFLVSPNYYFQLGMRLIPLPSEWFGYQQVTEISASDCSEKFLVLLLLCEVDARSSHLGEDVPSPYN